MTPSERDLEKAAAAYAKEHWSQYDIYSPDDLERAHLAGARSRDAELSSLQSENASLKKRLDDALCRYEVKEQEFVTQREGALRSEVEKLKAENRELSGEIASLLGAIGNIQIRLAGAELDCESAWEKNTLLRSRLAAALCGERNRAMAERDCINGSIRWRDNTAHWFDLDRASRKGRG